MRPDAPFVMRAALKTLEEIAAGRTDDQEIARIRGLTTLLTILQREWDSCASTRVAGISRYADIVRRGSLLLVGDRRERLRRSLAAVEDGVQDLRISSLEVKLDLLRATIIDLQSWLEGSDVPEERELLVDIWQAEYEDAKNDDRNPSFW